MIISKWPHKPEITNEVIQELILISKDTTPESMIKEGAKQYTYIGDEWKKDSSKGDIGSAYRGSQEYRAITNKAINIGPHPGFWHPLSVLKITITIVPPQEKTDYYDGHEEEINVYIRWVSWYNRKLWR